MPFKKIIALVFALYTLYLIATDQFQLYVHPRYHLFSAMVSVLAVVFIGISLMFEQTKKQPLSLRSSIPLLILVLLALVIPPTTLTARTANNRTQSVANTQQVSTTIVDSFTNDLSRLTLREWVDLIATSSTADILGKKAVVSGFVRSGDGAEDMFYVSQFQVSCCAVDASPLSVPVQKQSWRTELKENSWYKISGTYIERNGSPVIQPTEITPIDTPGNPYVF